MSHVVQFRVNGYQRLVAVEPRETLLEVLRDRLGLTGTKEGCGNGNCGSCTVLVDGLSICSCLVFGVEAHGKEIVTVEGLATDGRLHPLQEAFLQWGGLQCGICTPGFLVSAKWLLDRNPDPTEMEIRSAIVGNLCRCTGYDKIVKAIQACAQSRGEMK